ncbi:MAG: hypothetical protein AB7N24_16780 [Dehalococcoidia bacterium]
MAAISPRSNEPNWVVELATGRIVQRPLRAAAGDAILSPKLAERLSKNEEEIRVNTEKQNEQARRDLNPIEDVKGAVRFVKKLDPIEEIKDFMESAAEVLEPRESDLRIVEPEADLSSSTVGPGKHGKGGHPVEVAPWPDAKEMNKEHRGY